MSNQRLMKAKEKAGDGYAKTNAIGGGVERIRVAVNGEEDDHANASWKHSPD